MHPMQLIFRMLVGPIWLYSLRVNETIGCHDLNFKLKFSLYSVESNARHLPQSTIANDALKLFYS